MRFKKRLALETGLPEKMLPSGYQIVGRVLLLKLPFVKKKSDKKKIALSIIKTFPYIETVCEIKKVSGKFRKPSVSKIVGGPTETTHSENSCLFRLDVSKIMFSKGNHFERQRLIDEIKKGETIVDMFAGIGYFSIPLSRLSAAGKIYSIEKNKAAFRYLKENISLNKAARIKPIHGDNKKIKLVEKADRVLMGYLPKTCRFLHAAFGFLKDRGIITYHDTFSKQDLWGRPFRLLSSSAEKSGFRLEKILYKGIVKSYAPNVFHVVVDAEFAKSRGINTCS